MKRSWPSCLVLLVAVVALASACRRSAGPMMYLELHKKAVGETNFLPVDPATSFRTGDQFILFAQPKSAGEFYVLAQGTSGALTRLFPNSAIPGQASSIVADQEVVLPDRVSAFTVSGAPGREILYFVFSARPLPELMGLDTSLRAALDGVRLRASSGGVEAEKHEQGLRVRARGSEILVYEMALEHTP